MKKSLKIASATVLCAVFALTLTFCGSKTAETQAETQDTVTVEADTAQVEADTTQVPADTTTAN
jgi:hypothetical protein